MAQRATDTFLGACHASAHIGAADERLARRTLTIFVDRAVAILVETGGVTDFDAG